MLEKIALLSITLITVLVFMGVGRLVYAHVENEGHSTSFNSLMTGLGVWTVWFLLFQGVVGASLMVVWWIFLASALALMLVMTKVHKFEGEEALFWPKIIIGLVLCSPVLIALTTHGPLLWTELTETMKNADHILRLGGLPQSGDVTQFDMMAPGAPVGNILAILPAAVMRGAFHPAVFALLNILVCIAAAVQMVRLCGVRVGWHNALLMSAVGLFGLSLLNPFFMPTLVTAALPDVLIAATLFAAATPLLQPQPLPDGLGAVPTALTLSFLMLLSPMAVPLVGVVVVFWAIRRLLEEAPVTFKDVIAWLILALLPSVAWMVWHNLLIARGFAMPPLGLPTALTRPAFVAAMHDLATTLVAHPLMAIALVLMLGKSLHRLLLVRGGRSLRRFVVEEAALSFPLVFVLIYLLVLTPAFMAGFAQNQPPVDQGAVHFLLRAQFFVLLPLWLWVTHGVAVALGGKAGVKTSSAASFVMAALFVGVAVTSAPRFQYTPPAPLDHTLRVAQAIHHQNTIPWGSKVAVLDSLPTQGYYAAALAFGLRHHAIVRPVLADYAAAKGSFDIFHDKLVRDGFEYLWVHAATADMGQFLGGGIRADTSYLYRIVPEGLQPVESYPHTAYTAADTAYKNPLTAR